ncbi:MAG: hypothetical protein IJW63_05210 [Lachnospiraceae bacterium]|nr:hypothetical protein [Lachnospiraceae bacterium]
MQSKTKDIVYVGMMIAIIEVSKRALDFLPNVELVTFWVIMFTLFLGWKAIYGVIAFTLIEMCFFGIHTWVIMYFYIWPLLVVLTMIFRKKEEPLFWAILSGFYGLLFGAGCSLPYFFIGAVDGGVAAGFRMMFTWWIAGIPYDFIHGIANFVIMLVLFVPVYKVVQKVKASQGMLE